MSGKTSHLRVPNIDASNRVATCIFRRPRDRPDRVTHLESRQKRRDKAERGRRREFDEACEILHPLARRVRTQMCLDSRSL